MKTPGVEVQQHQHLGQTTLDARQDIFQLAFFEVWSRKNREAPRGVTSWWFQPSWKILVKMDHLSR